MHFELAGCSSCCGFELTGVNCIIIIVLLFHCRVILPYKGKRTGKIFQRITMYNPGLTGFLLREDRAKTKCSGIINLLFGILVPRAFHSLTHTQKNFTHLLSLSFFLAPARLGKILHNSISVRMIYQNTEEGVFNL